jgi:hypothetical protein
MLGMMRFARLTLWGLTSISALTHSLALDTLEGPPPAPVLEWLLTYSADFDLPFDTGEGLHGRRVVMPLRGGTFDGPEMSGTFVSLVP